MLSIPWCETSSSKGLFSCVLVVASILLWNPPGPAKVYQAMLQLGEEAARMDLCMEPSLIYMSVY